MAIIHITSSRAWLEIQRDGRLASRVSRGIESPGPDGNKVSALSGVDTADRELLAALCRCVSNGKRVNLAVAASFASEPLVVLEISEDAPVSWEPCPREKNELVNALGLPQAMSDRIGEYLKTDDDVPLDCLRVVVP